MQNLLKKLEKIDVVFLVCIVGITVYFCIRNVFGIAYNDESFYTALAYRLCKGDGLFVQEWHVAQMSSFTYMWLVKLFLICTKSTQGILLFMRYAYTLMQCMLSLYIYYRLKSINKAGAMVAALVFYGYIPFSIAAMSYNTVAIAALTFCFVTVLTAKNKLRWQYFLAGLAFAMAVLCAPYLAILFLIYLLISIFNKKRDYRIFNLKNEGKFFVFGIVIMAILFLVFVLSKASIKQIRECLPYVLNDPTHDVNITVIDKLIGYFSGIFFAVNKMLLPFYIAYGMALIVYGIDKNRKKHLHIYYDAIGVIVFACELISFFATKYVNMLLFPLHMLVIFCVISNYSDVVRKITLYVWAPGMIYTFCLHMSSNQSYVAVSSSSIVALVGGIIVIAITFEDNKRYLQVAWKVLFVMMLFMELGLRGYVVMSDGNIFSQKEQISIGAEKGIIASYEQATEYNRLTSLLDAYSVKYNADSLACVFTEWEWTLKTPYYISDKYSISSPSAWMLYGDKVDISKKYFEVNPEKTPEMIYLSAGRDDDYLEWLHTGRLYEEVYSENNEYIYIKIKE